MPAAVEPGTVLKLSRQGSLLIANEVYLDHRGPFRMLIDTGSVSSSVPQDVARRIGLTPTFAVEQVTPAGINRVAATLLDEVTVGSVTRHGVEVLILADNVHGFDGILGQSWLAQSNYLLDYCGRRLIFDPKPPTAGTRLAMHTSEGRPAVKGRVGGREMELVLDSGTEKLVLFGAGPPTSTVTMFTTNGPVAVAPSRARVVLGDECPRTMETVHVTGPVRPGLLPLAGFAAVYVSNRDSTVVLVPRSKINR
jgi:predicted aspartyl protease